MITKKIPKTEVVFEDAKRGTRKVVIVGRKTKKRYLKDYLNSIGFNVPEVTNIVKVSVYDEVREMDEETFIKWSNLAKK